jgi:class 3 adenylate cyclase
VLRCALVVAAVHDLGLEVRLGVHTGECEVVGDAGAGLAVHIGARITALAGRSEVLVSSTVKDLVVGSGSCLCIVAGTRPVRAEGGGGRVAGVSGGRDVQPVATRR